MRQSPRTLGHRREQGIIATVINHPELLAEYAERLARLDLGDERLRRLVEALVDITAEAADLDTDALRGHLCEQGFSKVLESLLSLDVYRMNPSARPETPLVEVRAAWRHLLDLHGETEARQQVHLAVERLAQDPSEENLARLRAQQRSAEGGESRRTAFDTPAAAEPGKSD